MLFLSLAITLSLSVIFRVLPAHSPAFCYMSPSLMGFGFVLTFASFFVKIYRLHKIFNNPVLVVVSVRNTDLLMAIGAMMGVGE